MEVSDVRVRLVKDANERLKAVCSVTLDGEFVVRDVKVVEGTNGLFVAMPSRKLTSACPKCRTQNHLRARHCNECGAKLPQARIPTDTDGREKVHRDIAHPITAAFRQTVQQHVLEAYQDAADSEGMEDEADVDADTGDEESTDEDSGSEYDSIIADLRSGTRFEGSGNRTRDDGDRDQPRRRKRRRRPRESGAEETAGRPVEAHAATADDDTGKHEDAGDADKPFGADLDKAESPDERQRDTVGASTADSRDRPSDSFGVEDDDSESKRKDDRNDESTPFGEGLL
jgi:stage V sporulation protein G